MGFYQRILSVFVLGIALLCNAQVVLGQKTRAERRYEDSVAAVQRAEKANYIKYINRIASDSVKQQIIPIYSQTGGTVTGNQWFINKPLQRKSTGSEAFFYMLAGIVLILGLVRVNFPKYFSDLFRIFFRATVRQQSIRDQLLQSSFPAFMLNMLFFFSGGLFLTLLSQYYGWMSQSFWYSILFWAGLLIAVYGFKLLVMQFLSWLFHMRDAGKTYSFIVFLMNKVMGVMLLPIIVLMALGPVTWRPAIVTLALILLAGLFIYRYLISYPSVKNTVRVNRFHFIIYLWALEIVPLLLIYKGLALQLSAKN